MIIIESWWSELNYNNNNSAVLIIIITTKLWVIGQILDFLLNYFWSAVKLAECIFTSSRDNYVPDPNCITYCLSNSSNFVFCLQRPAKLGGRKCCYGVLHELPKQEFLKNEQPCQTFKSKKYWIIFWIGPERRRKARLLTSVY